MVNVRLIKVSKFLELGFKTKKEALYFIKNESIKSNKNQNENDILNIVKMKRQDYKNQEVTNVVNDIMNNIKIGEDITINQNMSAEMAKEVVKRLNDPNKKLIFTVTYDNNEIRSYVNEKDFYVNDTVTPYGSDTQSVIIDHNATAINVKEFYRNDSNNKSTGAFFKYYNTTEIDLSRYGIYRNKYNHDNSCLIHALINSGKFSDDEINTIKLYSKRRETSLKTLNAIADEFNITFNIYRYRNDQEKIEKNTVGSGKQVDVALYDHHWFIYEDVNITRFFINHYNEINKIHSNVLDFKTVNKYCKKTNKYVPRTDRKDTLNSLSLVHYMYKNNLFKRINIEDAMEIPYYDNFKDDNIVLKTINGANFRLKVKEHKKCKYDYITFADFETTTMQTMTKNASCHKPFLISYLTLKNEVVIERDTFAINENNTELFLDKLHNNSIIYFHNLKYDKNFLFDNLTILKYTDKDGQLYEIKALYKKKTLYFRDSYKLISEPLSNFQKMFGLNVKKEVFPYNFYNESNIDDIMSGKMMSILTAKKAIPEDKHDIFDECIKNVTHTKTKFNALEYVKFYCEQDVNVLHEGVMTFRTLILEALKIDLFDKLTISSIADQYLMDKGCYDGVYELSGVIQAFINKSVYGGRVMIARNEPMEVMGPIQDFDACGLYASAMHTMKGFPIGLPSIINVDTFDHTVDPLYYIEIELQDEYYNRGIGPLINENRHKYDYDFPLFSDKIDGIIEYTNFPKTRRHVVNNEILSDLIKFYDLEKGCHFKIIQGVIFNDGYNNKINDVMRFLYDERRKQKKAKNKIEQIYKLIMNSSYGKTLTKYNDTTIRIFTTSDIKVINSFIYNNYNNIKEILYTKNHTIIKIYNEYCKHWNCVHVGSAVLSRSKAIMNNIFYICHIKGLTPLYQDTDSIHIPEDQISQLPSDFIGNDMCQFHCDFSESEFKKIKDHYIKDEAVVYSAKSIFLAKKCYVDVLKHRYSDEIVYHKRFKGVNEDVIEKTALEKNMTIYELYKYRLDGNVLEFNDKYSNKPKFKQNSLSSIMNRDDNIKIIK
jgi:hypothetical protein